MLQHVCGRACRKIVRKSLNTFKCWKMQKISDIFFKMSVIVENVLIAMSRICRTCLFHVFCRSYHFECSLIRKMKQNEMSHVKLAEKSISVENISTSVFHEVFVYLK